MRKPRDFDSEMKALTDRARLLKERKLHQLGELVIATGADALPVEHLAGALLAAVEIKEAAVMESWRERGAAYFQSRTRTYARRNRGDARSAPAGDGRAESLASDARA